MDEQAKSSGPGAAPSGKESGRLAHAIVVQKPAQRRVSLAFALQRQGSASPFQKNVVDARDIGLHQRQPRLELWFQAGLLDALGERVVVDVDQQLAVTAVVSGDAESRPGSQGPLTPCTGRVQSGCSWDGAGSGSVETKWGRKMKRGRKMETILGALGVLGSPALNRTLLFAVLCATPACAQFASDDPESLGETSQALNGTLSPLGFLVRRDFDPTDEAARRFDTNRYYNRPGINPNGTGDAISLGLRRLADFRDFYGFANNEVVAKYYNKGDLGLGREMHCVDRFSSTSEIACYVTNFAAGDAGSEFTFGLSSNIAFTNMALGNKVATVAMVFRWIAQPTREQVMFVVYDGADELADTAPLDRHGLNFFNAFDEEAGVNPDPSFGTPGVELNNHMPSNCLNCHGGVYTPSDEAHIQRNVNGAWFLPFDLDQFEFSTTAGETRAAQEDAFRELNEMVRKVAWALDAQSQIVKQIDGWYNNTSGSWNLSGTFNSAYVPPGWLGSTADTDVYRRVVRPSCRGCHMTNAYPFDDAVAFRAFSTFISNDIVNHSMPHALQSQRLFWQSSQPSQLENYFRSWGLIDQANAIQAAGPGSLVTLDPPLIMTTL